MTCNPPIFKRIDREVTAVSPGSQAVDVVASVTGRGRNEIHRLMLSQRGDAGDAWVETVF